MTTKKASIAECLNELKLLDSRIQREIASANFVAARIGKSDRVQGGTTLPEFIRNAQAASQSIHDLQTRRMKIKNAIVLSNATTIVTLGNKTMTVAEAIETRKHSIGYKRATLKRMTEQWAATVASVERANLKLQQETTAAFSKVNDVDLINKTIEAVMERDGWAIVDPTELNKRIKELTEEIEAFDSGFDLVINASNYSTFVEI